MSSCSVHLVISGLVQGVGYRYFCYRAASRLKLTGGVKNNRDGTVEVEAEGERSLLEDLIKELKVGPFGASVRDMKIEWGKWTGKWDSFMVTG